MYQSRLIKQNQADGLPEGDVNKKPPLNLVFGGGFLRVSAR